MFNFSLKPILDWVKTVGAVFVAFAAALYFTRASMHRKKQADLARKIEDKQAEAGADMKAAKAEKAKKEAAYHRAKAALKEGEARIKQLEENGHETLADRVRRRNERLRNRRSS